jgi:hypothetical protein
MNKTEKPSRTISSNVAIRTKSPNKEQQLQFNASTFRNSERQCRIIEKYLLATKQCMTDFTIANTMSLKNPPA